MDIINRTINVFEKRVSELEKIRYLPDLPQWTDADVIAASCLIKQYRNLTSEPSPPLIGCSCPFREKHVDGKYLVCPNCGSRVPIAGG